MDTRRLTGVCLVVAVSGQPAFTATCDALSPTARSGLLTYILYEHGGPMEPTCGETFTYAYKAVVEDGRAALPCLSDLYRHGLTGNPDLWGRPERPPGACPWTLPLIRAIDPAAARPFYEGLRSRATTHLASVSLSAELALLGETRDLPLLVAFLREGHREPEASNVEDRVLAALSLHNYRPARRVLRETRGRLFYPLLADVCVAQFDRDTDRLVSMVSDGRTYQAAALALHYMGADEVLEAIAANTSNPSHAMAAAVLRGEIRP